MNTVWHTFLFYNVDKPNYNNYTTNYVIAKTPHLENSQCNSTYLLLDNSYHAQSLDI